MTATGSIVAHERLGDLFDFQNGRGFKKSEWSRKGLPIIRIQNLNDPDAPFNRFNGAYSEDILVSTGDLLFSWSGTVGSSFGPHIWQRENGVLNQHIFKVLPKRAVDLRYAFYALEQITQDIEQEVSGSVGLVHITKKRLHEFTIPVPPLPEQRRIVAILDEAFEGIAAAKANAESNCCNARSVFRSCTDEAFQEAARFSSLVELGNTCDFVRGPFGGSLKKSMFVTQGFAVYEQQHAINDQFSDVRYFVDATKFDSMKRFQIRPYDLIMSCSGTMGRVAIAPLDVRPGIINQALLKLTPSKDLDGRFLRYWMDSSAFQAAIKERSGGAAMQNVASVKTLKKIAMPLPDLHSQRRVVGRIESAKGLTADLERCHQDAATALDELKVSLLHQAFTGQL